MKKIDEAEIDGLLADLWKRNLPLLQERVTLLESAAAAAAGGTLNAAARAEALGVAHKLSGSLGMFGYHHGTAIAREIELLLSIPGPNKPADHLSILVADLRRTLFPES
jgi:HPt (histidine-containing phosphotransfer) domain-containing protein